jgi:hypothetical protein
METAATQKFIDIAGIQEGVVILKNGGYRMIFAVSAVNFSLKSEEEQNSIIFQYQSFLNSLHFPVQVVMRSKRLDLNPYIKKINEAKDKQTSELIKMQTEDYIDFISQLINLANIMKKTFYVIVPYDPVSVQGPSILNRLFKKSEDSSDLKIAAPTFKRFKDELTQRASSVASGLGTMGLHCVQLSTEEIIELFYGIYNPGVADKERFSNAEDLISSFVAGEKEKPKNPEGEKLENTEKKKEEEVIDNSGIVEEQHKQAVQTKQMEADNEGERQIAAKEPDQVPKTSEPAPVTPAPATVKISPLPAPVTEPPKSTPTTTPGTFGNDIRPNTPPTPPPPTNLT